MGDWRPRSADETTVPAWSPQPSGEGSGLLRGTEDTGQPRGLFRPRPVSTGDLERVLPADLGLQRAGADTASTSSFFHGIEVPAHALDPKYQCDLVARGGQEVYPYPSPLHAVALQSPLFALPKDAPSLDSQAALQKPPLSPSAESRTGTGPICELGSAEAYIDRLLRLRLQGRGTPLRGVVGEQGLLGSNMSPFPQKFCGQKSGGGGQVACETVQEGTVLNRGKDSLRQPGPAPLVDTESLSGPLKEESTPRNACVRGENTGSPSPCPQAQQPHSDPGQTEVLLPSRPLGPKSPSLAPEPFAHPPCTSGETFPMRLRMGPPQSRAVKVRRRVSDKLPRLGKRMPPRPERQRDIQAASRPPEWDSSPEPRGGGLNRRPTLAREPPGRSCSESTLYPVPFVPLVVARQDGYGASSQALFPGEAAPVNSAAGRKQRRWRSTVEISAKAHLVGCPGPGLRPPRSPTRRAGGPWVQSRPTLARQDACVRSESDPSEHSAESTSLLHSTIAETSEEEASDHTANRFGDESSGSDSEVCVQGRGGGLAMGGAETGQREPVWPRAVPQQHPQLSGGTRPPLPPVPKLCRIKASKALKKKIRRFQPAALKVMTMV
ncbi:dapper homolog 2 [Nannospalax galili]|uniref:dapper homolog 2 n=1 Tax=Nannospalax galili TaxID=1026970 RepID=UPI0004ED6049|nr:dapper homolog 2 [Nannospalax galili]